MKFYAVIKGLGRKPNLGEELEFDSEDLETICKFCPIIKELFYEKNGRYLEDDGKEEDTKEGKKEKIIRYTIAHTSPKLRELMSKIDKFGKKHRVELGRKYLIRYDDPRLEEADSQINKLISDQTGKEYDSITSHYANSLRIFRTLIGGSMSKQKDIEVKCLNSESKKKDIEVRCLS